MKLEVKKDRGRIALDVFQANPLKIFHIGHLFNAVLGESIRRLLGFVNCKTVTYSYSGDVGVHIARWLWYFKNFYKGKIPKEEPLLMWVKESLIPPMLDFDFFRVSKGLTVKK